MCPSFCVTFLTPASPPGEDLGSAPYGILKKPVNGRKMKDPAQDFGEDFFYPPNDKSEYSRAMKSHFRKSGNQMSGKWESSYASLLT